MKLSEKLAAHAPNQPFYTFEFFPPRTDKGFDNLVSRISRLSALSPIAVSVTWGAGGSTRDRSLDLAGLTQADYGIDTILHLTCTNMLPGMVDDALREAKARGIQNILALRGDPPRGQELWTPIDPRFTSGLDLVKYIRSSAEYSSHFCIGVAAYPEGQPEDDTVDILKQKVDAGADFIVTQLFCDSDRFVHWIRKVRARGISVPVIPGVMPIQTYESFLRVVKLCGVQVPSDIMTDLHNIRHDDQLVKDYGVRLAVDIIRKITGSGMVSGVHFCTLNLEKSVQRVLQSLEWAGGNLVTKNKLIVTAAEYKVQDEDSPLPSASSQVSSSDLVVSPSLATTTAANALAHKPTLDVDPPGRGEINDAATWDEFPNGRFGDYKSPAFGMQDQWGGLGISVHASQIHWGNPTSTEDLTKLFLDYLSSDIPSTPFSTSSLSAESETILGHLKKLTSQGLWTVCSQPAIDNASSADETFGWGPRGGYVSQKAFIEFFAEEKIVNRIEEKIDKEGQGWIHYFVANSQGECRTNVLEDERNAVTWGVFPGQEVVQTTIIEQESFLTWKDEAFSIWAAWASSYAPGSSQRTLLDNVREKRWLVNIVHDDFKRSDALWRFLLDG